MNNAWSFQPARQKRRLLSWKRTSEVLSLLVLATFIGASAVLAAPGDITLASTSFAGVKGNGVSRSPSLSADGTKVAFISDSTNLDPLERDRDITADIYVKDLVTGEIELASTSTDGVKADESGGSGHPSLSADGGRVAFTSAANNLHPSDSDGTDDIFVKDLVTNQTILVSVSQTGVQGNNNSSFPAISADGTKVAFQFLGTSWGPPGIYVKDLLTGELTLVSSSDPPGEVSGNDFSFQPAISADGTKVAFTSLANNLDPADGDSLLDVYAKDLATGDLTLVSASTTGEPGNGESYFTGVTGAGNVDDAQPDPFSRDGTAVAFASTATNLDPLHDPDSIHDIFVKDLATGVLTLASTSDAAVKGNGSSLTPSLSSDGTKVTFISQASNLDCLDGDDRQDVYLKDLLTGDLTLVSVSESGEKGNFTSLDSAISSDGSRVAFRSESNNLHPSDPVDLMDDIFVKEPRPTSCPSAVDDTLTTQEDTPGNVNVLTNDTDPDGDALSVTGNTQGANGSVTCSAEGGCTYTPNAGFNGSDAFTYEISDGYGGTDTATVNVTVTVNDPPDAVDDALTTQEDTPGTVNVLANDMDPDGDALTATGHTQGANGTVSCEADGECTYTPSAGFSGTDSFTYTISDGNGGIDTASVNVTVRATDVTEVDIKVSPWRNISLTNTKSLKVVILSTPGFDAATADLERFCFGDAEEPSERNCEPLRPALVDVDRDGDLDLVLHFKTDRTGIDVGDTEVCLHGMTLDGTPIEGCTEVRSVGS